MSRYQYILNSISLNSTLPKMIGIFPFNALVDAASSNIHQGKLEFFEEAVDGLKLLGQQGTSVVLFINQFKDRQLGYEQFTALNQAIEKFIRQYGIQVLGVYWCPTIDKRDPFVVPNSGMFNKVTENQGIDWNGVPVISSSDNDLAAAAKVNATPIKIGKGPSKWTSFDSFKTYVVSR